MTETAERQSLCADGIPQQTINLSYSRPEQGWFSRTLIRAVEQLTGQRKLKDLYSTWANSAHTGENPFSAAVRILNLSINAQEAEWSMIPKNGPLLVVCNHPFGVIDGLVAGHLLSKVRPDVKIMTHSLLCQPPAMKEYLLPVDFGNTSAARQVSALTRRQTVEWLSKGHTVVMFPAGSVSTAQRPFSGPALDPDWHPFAGKLSRLPGVTVLPVYFHGQNSRLFQLASHIHYALRVSLLFHETVRRAGSLVSVSVGQPISGEELSRSSSDQPTNITLRHRTLSLAGPGGPDPALAFRWPAHISWD
jgi:putative hemolysin